MLKNVFVLGDSYSTFEGYVPEGYVSYYRPDGPSYLRKKPELEKNENDVFTVEQTWWYNLIKENGNLLLNCSWSGTTICNTGYNGCDNSKCSFVARIEKLIEEGYFKKNKVDTFLLFGGTNDNWSDAPLGKAVYSDWTKEDLYNVFPGFTYLIHLLKTNLPDTKIYFILNHGFKAEITDFYKQTCEKNAIPLIELHDIEKREGHPTIKGMETIKNQVLDFIKAENNK